MCEVIFCRKTNRYFSSPSVHFPEINYPDINVYRRANFLITRILQVSGMSGEQQLIGQGSEIYWEYNGTRALPGSTWKLFAVAADSDHQISGSKTNPFVPSRKFASENVIQSNLVKVCRVLCSILARKLILCACQAYVITCNMEISGLFRKDKIT